MTRTSNQSRTDKPNQEFLLLSRWLTVAITLVGATWLGIRLEAPMPLVVAGALVSGSIGFWAILRALAPRSLKAR
jgi:hypothetical protein